MFVKNAWYIAEWASALGPQPVGRRICNEPVVLFRDQNGLAGALSDMCSHRAAPLSLGRVTQEGLECGYHGLVFERSGACVRIPGQDAIPAKACVRSYPVVEKDGFIWIWMGKGAADESLIIDYPVHNDPVNWPRRHDTYHVKANYMLLVDNLMDLTHLGYVHTSTIGGNPQIHVDAKMDIARTPRGLKFTRWMLNSAPPPTYRAAVPTLAEHVDRWQEFEFIAPGTIVQWSGATDAGTGAYERGLREGGFSLRLLHGITPETETTSFYFWSAANGYRQDDPAASDQLFQQTSEAFQEDKAVIERQQQRLTEFGEDSLVAITSDKARIAMRQTVRAMMTD